MARARSLSEFQKAFSDEASLRCVLIQTALAAVPCAEVIEASSLIQGFSQIRDGAFDLVLIGVDRSSFEPLDALKAAREASPATRFAIISSLDTPAEILASLAAGFHGFISKHQSDTDIIAAITAILSGRIYAPWSLTEAGDHAAVGNRFRGKALPGLSTEVHFPKLTARQREVLSLLAGGQSNKEMARVLGIAEATTKIHMAALLRALGVRNRTEAAYRAGNLVNSTGHPPNPPATNAHRYRRMTAADARSRETRELAACEHHQTPARFGAL